MYSFNRFGGLGSQQTRQFSTGPETKPYFNTMPSSTGFLSNVNFDYQNIRPQKKFLNPNFVNEYNPNVHSCPKNLKLLPCQQLKDLCSEFVVKTNSLSVPPVLSSYMPFNTEQLEKKENTQRKKEYRRTPHGKKARDHCPSPRKAHKNKMNIELKYEIDEVGIDVLSDTFESDSNDTTPTVDIQVPPVFIHETQSEFEINKVPSSPICIRFEAPERLSTVLLSINTDTRRRLPSECGSEDSFILFDYGSEEDDDTSDFEYDTDSDDEEGYSVDSADDKEKELLCKKTDEGYSKDSSKQSKKVTFANDLCKVYPMIAWSHAYQAARKGPWEEHARDRCRFKDRISKMEKIIGPILKTDHRLKVFKEICQ